MSGGQTREEQLPAEYAAHTHTHTQTQRLAFTHVGDTVESQNGEIWFLHGEAARRWIPTNSTAGVRDAGCFGHLHLGGHRLGEH